MNKHQTIRQVKQVIPAETINMGGIIIEQALPAGGLHHVDPFLLIHHWIQTLPGGNKQLELGVGPHPHRGFSPVTLIFKGALHHRDSHGNDSIVKAGGAQWMHAGSGIMHSERPTKELAKRGGELELIQFWINDPAKHKMTKPQYYPLTKEETPVHTSEDGLVKTYIVAGKFLDKKGPIPTLLPLLILRFEFAEGAKFELELPPDFNALFYQLDGSLMINNLQRPKGMYLTLFETTGGIIKIQALRETRAILLSGKPINEPVASYGPIVMNTQTEIMQALQDARLGKMGTLVETE